MKSLFFICIFFLLVSCQNSKSVYWCGDHACVNKKEKNEYFDNKMIVEKRFINKKEKKYNTSLDKILKRSGLKVQENNSSISLNEKKLTKKELSKQRRLEKKRILNEQREKAKKEKIEKKLKEQEEKRLKKLAKLEKKIIKKKSKETLKNEDPSKTNISNLSIVKNKFENLVKNVIENNKNKP